jgi:predicted membrane-bound mannosyltransferase
LNRAGGESPHIHPWYFYLRRLAFFHYPDGPVWTEGFILLLAMVGIGASFIHRRESASIGKLATFPTGAAAGGEGLPDSRLGGVNDSAGPNNRDAATVTPRAFVRFLAVFTILLAAVYSGIPYKTPWCMLNFLLGGILLAGVGAIDLFRWAPNRPGRTALAVALLLGAGHLGWEAWRASYPESASRFNPYVYAQTSPDLLNLVQKVDELSKVHPDGPNMVIQVMASGSDYWPLPWYFRGFSRVGWWDRIAPNPVAPVMIASAKFDAGFDRRRDRTHLMAGYFQLRPEVFLELYVEINLWKEYVMSRPRTPDDE